MKRIIAITMILMLTFAASAQTNVTQFLGIPVDGTKSTMLQKLKAKGYTYNSKLDCLEGEFNGRDVRIYIVTNNNKVYRIMVADAYPTAKESDIRIRFNTLCKQFAKNERYIPVNTTGGFEIDENEKISTQITLYDKRYEAGYFQLSKSDTDILAKTKRSVWFMISESFGMYSIIMYYDNEENAPNGEDL